jgi:hypothetical protein
MEGWMDECTMENRRLLEDLLEGNWKYDGMEAEQLSLIYLSAITTSYVEISGQWHSLFVTSEQLRAASVADQGRSDFCLVTYHGE